MSLSSQTSSSSDENNVVRSLSPISTADFTSKYMKRLELDPTLLSQDASKNYLTYDFLCQLTEAHVKHIPFENLAQHGGRGGLQTLNNMDEIVDKVLVRQRGGFCFELNGMLCEFLKIIGFEVTIVPAIVYQPEIEFNRPKTHIFLMVANPNDNDASTKHYFVDVAFGEPAIHPLRYEMDTEQLTAEGMLSRFRTIPSAEDSDDDGKQKIILEWYKDGEWKPRLQWFAEDAETNPSDSPVLSDYEATLKDLVQAPESAFSKKIIVCQLTRTQKKTLAGNMLKITGPPRFPSKDEESAEIPVTKTFLDGTEEVRQVLREEFGISLDETEMLDLSSSLRQDESMWGAM